MVAADAVFQVADARHPQPVVTRLITLAGVLVVLLAVILIPSSFLAQVQGYRPLQTAPIMLMAAHCRS